MDQLAPLQTPRLLYRPDSPALGYWQRVIRDETGIHNMSVTGSTTVEPPALGRHREKAAIDHLLSVARSGRSSVLVIEGSVGIGKSMLLDYASARAAGFRVVRVAGTESEMELPFAALHQLWLQLQVDSDHLPEPQRKALNLAFGLATGGQPDSFLVGLALLSLLSTTAQEVPHLLLVDDAQWLDQVSRQVLGFVGRRLEMDSVAICFATRRPIDELSGIAELHLDGLSADDAHRLLDTVLPGSVAPRVREMILEFSEGNPLAILEIPRGLSAIELAGEITFGGFSGPLSPVERVFEQQIEKLPADTQTLLLLAAAEPHGSWSVVSRAARLLGVEPGALNAAEHEGLVTSNGQEGIRFRHPLVRSTVYRVSSVANRHAAHQALATTLSDDHERDRRAWHRALAAIGPDEDLAAELEASATQAAERGGLAAQTALLSRAVALTPDPLRRNERALRAAEAALRSGNVDEARHYLESTDKGPLDASRLARKHQLEARLHDTVRPSPESVASLVQAAAELLPYDRSLARDTYLEALLAAMVRSSSSGKHGWVEIARSLRELLDRSGPPEGIDLMLDGLTTTMIDGHVEGAPLLARALSGYLSDDVYLDELLRWWQLGFNAAALLWDDVAWSKVMVRAVQAARERGELRLLGFGLIYLAVARVGAGELDLASAAVQEGEGILASIGQPMLLTAGPFVEAARGFSDPRVAEGAYGRVTEYTSRMLLANGHADYQAGLQAAHDAFDHDVIGKTMVWQEIIEIASGCGDHELANAALEVVRSQVEACRTDFGLGTLARCEALLSSGKAAEDQYREAITRLDHPQARFQFARAHLVFGEWLQRDNRETEAQHHLQVAHGLLSHMGAQAFAGRAETALKAAGWQAKRSRRESSTRLTARESQIATLAAQRQTNAEIAAQLFVSPSTVDYHLRKVFQKLNVSSRRQLEKVLPQDSR